MILDGDTGAKLPGVEIWEIAADGRSAFIIGSSDDAGNYDVNLEDGYSNVNYVTDGYTGLNITAAQAAGSDAVLLRKDVATVPAKLSLASIPAWVWVLLAAVGIYYVGEKRKA